jgi:Bifunctional DNA primase/polymerase, N-terminal
MAPDSPQATLAMLYEGFGKAVLLPLPLATKRPTIKGWQNITYEQTQAPDYQKQLVAAIARGGNIGVRLGPLSGGLCTFDVDREPQSKPKPTRRKIWALGQQLKAAAHKTPAALEGLSRAQLLQRLGKSSDPVELWALGHELNHL